jgi:hypothetical protein
MSRDAFSGPYVNAAFLCEKVLMEGGAVPSFIRLIDKFQIPKFSTPIPPGVQVPQLTAQFTLVVLLRSGDIGSGSHDVTVRLQKPDQSYGPDISSRIFFQGSDDNGGLVILPMNIPSPQEGLHWFEVLFQGHQLLTRIPMRVVHHPAILQVQPLNPPAEG